MEGKGVMRYADGDIYEVETISSDPRSLKKVSFQGRWKCGLRDGMGEIVFQNGDYYRGHWTNDNMTFRVELRDDVAIEQRSITDTWHVKQNVNVTAGLTFFSQKAGR